jgi:hypothetical protein
MDIDENKRAGNAAKAKATADRLFPGEKWIEVEPYIYLSPRRAIGAKSNYIDEKRDADVLKARGSTIYLAPEPRNTPGRKADAIVDRDEVEFKNMSGKNSQTLIDHFYKSRTQAPTVFINLETSPLLKQDIMSALYGAVNSPKYEAKRREAEAQGKTFYTGGKVILKIRGQERLIFIKVDSLKLKRHKKTGRGAAGVVAGGGFSPQPR